MRHPNIAQLYEVLSSESRIFMITEYCSGGEVLDYICKHGRMNDTYVQTKAIFWQILDGIRYCHEKNYVHRLVIRKLVFVIELIKFIFRDLKLENILLDENLQVKIIDFGFTKAVGTNKLLDTFCGSVAYAAPG